MEEPLLPMPAEKAGREPGPERVRAGECETKLLARPDARRALTSRGRPSSLSPSISPHRNPAFFRLLSEPGFAADPASCPAPHAGPGWALVTAPAFLYKKGKSPSAPTIDPFSRLARTGGAILAAAALAAAALAATLILGFRRHAGALTAAVVRLQVLVPAIAGGVALFAGAPGAAVGLFLVAALAAWAIHLWRAEIGLCARLLGLAASCVADVPGLLAASAACAAAGALFATVFGGAAVAALANGSLVANPAVVAAANVGAACADAAGAAIPCCSWSPAPYAPPLALLALATAAWSAATAGEARTFILAGASAAWWYAPRLGGGSGSATSPPRHLLAGATRRAAGHALGPSAGTLAMGGAVMTASSAVRTALNSASSPAEEGGGGQPGLLWSLFAAVTGGLIELLQVVTKFATIGAAITGAGLLEAGRSATALLRSQALSALGVWYFPPLVLSVYVGLAAGLAGLGAGGAYALTAPPAAHGATGDDYAQTVLTHAVGLGVAAAALVGGVTSFATGVLLATVDTLFFAWAMDRAGGGGTSRPDAAAVFEAVPCGVVVEQPDGDLAYGAGGGGGGRRRYVPPGQMPPGTSPV